MSASLPMLDSLADMDSADDVDMDPFGTSSASSAGQLSLASMWGQPDVILAIQMLLEEETITSEEFNKVRDQVLIALSHMTESRNTQRIAKAIRKHLTKCESALVKDKQSRARKYLQAIVELFGKASA